LEDFYKISPEDIRLNGGRILLNEVFDGSVLKALQFVYPSHNWLPWKFSQALSSGYWNSKAHQRHFLDWLGQELGYSNPEDWYNITAWEIQMMGGAGLLTKYGDSPSKLIMSVYSKSNWQRWKFKHLRKYWVNEDNRLAYMTWLGQELGFKKMEDWYNLTMQQIQSRGGSGLMEKYGNSAAKLVMSVYPHHSWLEWKFKQVPREFWDTKNNQRKFMDWLGKEIGLIHMDDWYKVTPDHIIEKGGSLLLMKYDSFCTLLRIVYSEQQWSQYRFPALNHLSNS
jgi:hypothetical protein